MPILAQIFENENSISKLESFVSVNGAKHYSLKINKEKIKLSKFREPFKFKKALIVKNINIKIFNPDFPIFWKVL